MSAWLLSVLVSIGIALQAFGAVYWPSFLGYLGASPGMPFLLLAAALAPFCKPRNDMTWTADVARWGWWNIGYGFAVSLISILAFGWSHTNAQKTLTLAALTAAWLAPLLCVRQLYVGHLMVAVIVALAIATGGYILSDLLPDLLPSQIRNLIFASQYLLTNDERPRGFMAETSHFAALVGRLALILFLLQSSRKPFSAGRLTIFMVGLALGMSLLGSKGAAVAAVVAVIAMGFSRKLIPYLVIMLPVVWFVAESQTQSIAMDIENFTSTSTRLTLTLAAFSAIAINPLGYGFYGFYGAMQGFGGWALAKLSSLPLLLDEASEIITDLTNVSFKSTLLDFSVLFGILFFVLMWRIIRIIDTSDPRTRVALIYLGVSALGTAGHESVSFFLGLATLVLAYPRPFLLIGPAESRSLLATTCLRTEQTDNLRRGDNQHS